MGMEVWVVYYRNTDEDFGYSFDGVYVFKEENKAKETVSKFLRNGADYVTVRKCAVLEQIPDYI